MLEQSSWLHKQTAGAGEHDFSWIDHQPSSMTLVPIEGARTQKAQAEGCEAERWAQWAWSSPTLLSFAELPESHPTMVASASKLRIGPRLPVIDRLRGHATPTRIFVNPAGEFSRRTGSAPQASQSHNGNRFVTPASNNMNGARNPKASLSVRRTMPRTVARGDGQKMIVMSESKALKLMVKCAQASARKKNLTSKRKRESILDADGEYWQQAAESPLLDIRSPTFRHRRAVCFVTQLQALNLQDQAKNVDQLGTVRQRGFSIREDSPSIFSSLYNSSYAESGDHDQVVTSRVPRCGGFDAFVADLATGQDTADFQSNRGASRFSSPARYATGSSSDTNSEYSTDHDAPPPSDEQASDHGIIRSNGPPLEGSPVSLHTQAPVPRRLGRDEILSRLFPGYSPDTSEVVQRIPNRGNLEDVHDASSAGVSRRDTTLIAHKVTREADPDAERHLHQTRRLSRSEGSVEQFPWTADHFKTINEQIENRIAQLPDEQGGIHKLPEDRTRLIASLEEQHQRIEQNLEVSPCHDLQRRDSEHRSQHLEKTTREMRELLGRRPTKASMQWDLLMDGIA